MRNRKFLNVALTAFAAWSLAGCGDSARKPVMTPGVNLAGQNVPCTKDECPPVAFQLVGSQGAGNLPFKVDEDNRATLSVQPQQQTQRTYAVQVLSGPTECQWSGQGSPTVDCSWRPRELGAAGEIVAVVRDVSRCRHLLMPRGEDALCSDIRKNMASLGVEQQQRIRWEVVDSGVNMIDQGFFQNPGAKYGANGGVNGCTQGMITGVLGGMMGGGGALGTLGGGAMGCASNYIGALGQQQPTQQQPIQQQPGTYYPPQQTIP